MRPHWPIIAILLVAAALRFLRIDHQSFWNDEGNSARIAERSAEQIIAGAAADIHPPGYYFALAEWHALAGQSEFALRTFSALAGIVLVALLHKLGADWFGRRTGMLGAAVGALHPFLIYYSQEARMYALAAALGAATFWAAHRHTRGGARRLHAVAYVGCAAAGLYTHYSFAFVLVTVNLCAFFWLRRDARRLVHWLALQAGAAVLYLPWLPTAWRQVTTWPAARDYLPFFTALAESWRWLAYGPTIETARAAPGLVALGALALAGLLHRRALPPLLWLVVPAGLTLTFGLFSEAFAKFLLVSAPAVCLLAGNGLAGGIAAARRARAGRDGTGTLFFAGITAVLVVTWLRFDGVALANLYDNPQYFRADYRAMAATITADARPGDAVLLNAPNQWEVFTYYHPDDTNVFPVARTRPLDVSAQLAELEAIAASHERLFVLYWGDAQSDPERVVESWLNAHTFKASDQWYGDVRLATYAVPRAATQIETPARAQFGDAILLQGYALNAREFTPGDILQLTLFWRAESPISNRYKVFVHLYDDSAAPPVAQQDGEPGGGLALTPSWQPGATVADNHGVLLPPDLPSGEYRLVVGLYGIEDGQRLPVRVPAGAAGDSYALGEVEVVWP